MRKHNTKPPHKVDALASSLVRDLANPGHSVFPPSNAKSGIGGGEVSEDDIDELSRNVADERGEYFPPSTPKSGRPSPELEQRSAAADEDDLLFPPSTATAGPSPECSE